MVDESELLSRIDSLKELARVPVMDDKQKYAYVVRYTELLRTIREIKRGDENGETNVL